MTSRIGVVSDAVSEAVSDELTALASIYDADALYVMQARDGSTVVRCEVPIDLSAGLFFGVCPIILDLASAVQQALAAGATGAGTAVTGDAPRAAALLRRATSAQSGEVDGLRNPRLRLVLVQHLLPVLVELILPVGYPDSAPPNAQVSAPWLSVALAQELAAHAAVLWAELGQSATVYSYLEWVRTEAAAVLLRIAPTPAPSSAPAPASSGSPVEGVMAPAKTPTAVSLRSLSAGRVKLIAAAPGVGAEEALERAEATVERILSETTRLSTGHSPASDVPCLLIGGPCWVSSDPRFRERDSPAAVEHAPAGTDAVEGHQSADLPTLAAIMDALLEHSEEEAARRWASADHDCGVCLSTLKGARCQRIDECGHVFCKTCLRAAVAAALSDFTLGNAKQRVLRASACPDSACHGALSRDDIRLLCVNGPATAAAGATGRTHAGKSTSSLSADGPPPSLAALFERAAAEADVMVATEAAVRAAAGVTDGADVHTTPCPRPRCGHPALLHITAGDASQLLTTAWGLGCVAIEGSPHGIVLDYTAGGAAPRSGHPYRSGEKSPAFFPARRSMGHCTACGFAFCGQCQRSWHGGEPCTYHARTPVDLLLHITRIQGSCRVPRAELLQRLLPEGVSTLGAGARAGAGTGSQSGIAAGAGADAGAVKSPAGSDSSARVAAQLAKFKRDPKARARMYNTLHRAAFVTDDGLGAPNSAEEARPPEFGLGFELHKSAEIWSLAVEKFDAGVFAGLQAALLVAQSTRPCPKCGTLIERISGCHHMQCAMCSTPFCWTCGRRRQTRLQGQPLTSEAVCECHGGGKRYTVGEADVLKLLENM